MPRVVPSQIDNYITHVFPFVRAGTSQGTPTVGKEFAGTVTGLLELIDRIPEELITLTGQDYYEFVGSVATIRDRLTAWQNQQNPNLNTSIGQLFRGLNPVTIIHETIRKCPDQFPAAATSELAFVTDAELRQDLRVDIGAIGRALSNGEWKAATVLSGSTIEALLLWALQQCPVSDLRQVSQTAPKLPNKPLDQWHLPEYIDAAERLKILNEDTVTQVRLAKNFRDLIHPGRSQRLKQKCDRPTALSAVAGMEHVVRDLS
jgi:hypothetical protein